MGIENFISDALCRPNDYIAYYVSRKLAELHPDKSIIDSDTCLFDLEAYVRAGLCELVQEPVVFSHVKTRWRGSKRRLAREADNAWMNVLWQGHLIDVLFVTWVDDGCKTRHQWIVAETRQLAEDFFREVCEWCSEVRGEVLVYDDGGWEKSEELFQSIKAASFDNLVLPDALKQEIQNDFRQFFASREMYERYSLPWKRGVLLIGPPGNGKTHTIKALVNQTKQPCFYVKSFKSRYDSEQDGMRSVFARARQTTPCIIVLEDLDSLIDNKNRSFFLNELDGSSMNTGVVVLATTNHPERLDTAILDRPSRFDRKYYFELPGEALRLAYVRAWNEELQLEMRVTEGAITEVIAQTENFSFAYMKELFLSSMMQWMAKPVPASMDALIVDRAIRLHEQMKTDAKESAAKPDEATDDEQS